MCLTAALLPELLPACARGQDLHLRPAVAITCRPTSIRSPLLQKKADEVFEETTSSAEALVVGVEPTIEACALMVSM